MQLQVQTSCLRLISLSDHIDVKNVISVFIIKWFFFTFSTCLIFRTMKIPVYAISELFIMKLRRVKYTELSINANIYLNICNTGRFFALIKLQY